MAVGGGKADRIPELAAELVKLNVDVIVTQGPALNRRAKEATSTIPIVMGFDNDPVGNGIVASLARPGGNITGFSALSPELSGKQLELLKEILPKLSRVAVFGNKNEQANAQSLKEIETGAAALSIKPQYLDVKGFTEIDSAFRAASKGRADAAVMLSNGGSIRIDHRLPSWRSRAAFRRFTTQRNGSKLGASHPTGQT